ncbi:PAP2 superfamily protein [Planctomycetes bacterium Poly30]|uniref:PAP2 superfamily protein n=1 Tax=Saltatorellus ferox TaxID=2528018 RepID=A0A518EZX2_9BACT|nr:PAP2 superfamily protein [Planctomycetes bacterium Poly30]
MLAATLTGNSGPGTAESLDASAAPKASARLVPAVDGALEERVGQSLAVVYLAPMAISAAALALLYGTDLDGQLTDPFFDAASGTFPYRDDWLVGTLLHTFGKYLIIAISACLLSVSLGAKWSQKLRPWRCSAIYLLACIAVASAVIGLMKSVSPIPVPWNSVRYGGSTPHYLPFLAPAGAPHSGGWPCAHAAGAFALVGLYFLYRDSRPRLAWMGFAGAVALGSLYAGTQVLRGAHSPSHGVWSFMITWTICTVLYLLVLRFRPADAPAAPRGQEPE